MSKKSDPPRRDLKHARSWVSACRQPSVVQVKIETAKRILSLRKLLGEMWALYETKKTA